MLNIHARPALPAALTLSLSLAVVFATAAPAARPGGTAADRITGPIVNRAAASTRLNGNVHPNARPVHDRGGLDPTTVLNDVKLLLQPTAGQAAALEQLLEDQRNQFSPDYQNWLSPEEYGDRFGLSANDMAKIRSWLESEGMHVAQVARARNWILFSGSAAQLSLTFQTDLRRYDVNGEMHFANANAPAVPQALTGVVAGIAGLDDFRPKPQASSRMTRLSPQFNAATQFNTAPQFNASNGNHYLVPDDLAAIYDISPLYQAGTDGLGQKLVIAGQTDINLADIRGFRSQFNLTARDPQIVLAGTDPGVSSGDQIEADLDIEWSGAVARNATIIYVNSPNVFQSVQYAIDQNLAPVISLSYGACESGVPASYRSMVQQANAQGITWMASSGDSGAAGCDWNVQTATHGPSVIFPADMPEITAVGGTEFNESGGAGWNSANGPNFGSATGYLPEKAWNDSSPSDGLGATGGGISTVFPKPWWQTGPGVPASTGRGVPDISLTASGAHDGYIMFANGGLMSVGGTSASSPSFAGIVSLLNQYRVARGLQPKPGLGNINPSLYTLAQTTPAIFHDITTGDNIVPCQSGSTGCPASGSFGYKAGPGYDLVTGLGSVDAYNLVTMWSAATGVGTTMTLSASPAGIDPTATTQLMAAISVVSGTNPPTGSVTFTGTGGVSLGSATVTGSGTAGSATLAVKGSALVSGANVLTATYAPTGSFSGSTAQATVTVSGASVATTTSLAANPASLAASATTQLTASVRPASGTAAPTGVVTFAVAGRQLGSAPLAVSAGVSAAVLTVKGSSLSAGSNTITATYAATGSFSNSSATAAVTVTASPVATTITLTVTPASIAANGTTQLGVAIKASAGTATPSGTITFNLGNTVLGTEPLSTTGAATMTVKASSLASGANSITATYGGSTGFTASTSAPVTVTVAPAPTASTTTLAAATAGIAPTGSVLVTATVKPATTGSIVFSVAGAPLGTGILMPSGTGSNAVATASVTVRGASLTTGANTITGAFAGNASYAPSSGTVTVTLAAPPVATSITVAAAPAAILQTASTVLTATVKPASGTSMPTGNVSFSIGGTTLGSAPLTASGAAATATLTLKGSSLPLGNSGITGSYAANGNFQTSSGSVTIGVKAPPVATMTTLAASPASLAQTASTLLTATVKPATGPSPASGTITFVSGNATLGTAQLSGTPATATLTLKGSGLASGANTITAAYTGSDSFSPSGGSLTVTVTGPATAPKLSLAASPAAIASTASTQMTATVTPASGTPALTGTVTFSVGNTLLGTAPISSPGGASSGSSGTATLTVKGSSLAVGATTITATYSGASATSTVTVTSAGSSVQVSASTKPKTSMGLPVTVQLQEEAGVATTLNKMTVNGTDFTSVIGSFFGSAQLPAKGTLTANLYVQWSPLPATLTFAFGGTDAGGRQWTQTITVATGSAGNGTTN